MGERSVGGRLVLVVVRGGVDLIGDLWEPCLPATADFVHGSRCR